MIIEPPKIVSILGCSFMTIHTHTGPKIVSSKKEINLRTSYKSWCYCYKTNGKRHTLYIKGTKIISFPISSKFFTKKANIATNNFPNTADSTRSLSLAYLAIVALQARPKQ